MTQIDSNFHCGDDLYHACIFDWEASIGTHNSSLGGATQLKFATTLLDNGTLAVDKVYTHRSVLVADEAGVCVGGVGGQAAVEGTRDMHGGAAPLLHTLHTHTVAPGDRGRQLGTQGTALWGGGGGGGGGGAENL